MIYKYIRFSSDKQDEQSQENLINNYCNSKGLQIDSTIKDEAISGASDINKRQLKLLLKQLKQGDTLIISELSRLTRKGTIELNSVIAEYFKPARIRLIICNYGLDIDCANIDAMTELMLNLLATFARIERDSLRTRTKAALQARKSKGVAIGGDTRCWGKKSNKTKDMSDFELEQYRESTINRACVAAAVARKQASKQNPNNVAFKHFISDYVLIYGKIGRGTDWGKMVNTLNERGLKTASGLDFTIKNVRNMYYSISKSARF